MQQAKRIENLTQTLADELESTPIKVNSINPGATRTAMRASAYPAEDPTSVKSADTISPAYSYLMSEHCLLHGEQLNLVI
jgi:NAD(P)-dependent dehydrogenase (short-subunit alcohol dehydrogenase family)